MQRSAFTLICCLGLAVIRASAQDAPVPTVVDVADDQELRQAFAQAKPGTTIRIAPGTYAGGVSAREWRGVADRPIIMKAADPKRPPLIQGGTGIHIAGASYVEIRDLIIVGSTGNGINIDDGGKTDSSSHLTLVGLTVRDTGPQGNRDGIKLSGLDDFRVENCVVERWGSGGSGIDMVGCHRGEIVGCAFRHGDREGDNGVQAKGGSSSIAVRRCRFEHAGQRGVNLGGSTGAPFFRPKSPGCEAKDITVEDCVFIGSMTPLAFVGVDGAVVRRNTIYRPQRWGFRILQENTNPSFAPCRNGRFDENLIIFRSDEMVVPVNYGPGTAPETFRCERNAWYCLDAPQRSRPRLPMPETNGVYGVDPKLRDPDHGDLRPGADAPDSIKAVGARQEK